MHISLLGVQMFSSKFKISKDVELQSVTKNNIPFLLDLVFLREKKKRRDDNIVLIQG